MEMKLTSKTAVIMSFKKKKAGLSQPAFFVTQQYSITQELFYAEIKRSK